MKLTYSIYHRIIHSKSVYNGECGINNEVKNRFLKCLGNNSYLSELFLAGNCNFHCKIHIARSPSRVVRELSNASTVRPRFPMLTINQILGPHSGPTVNTTCLMARNFSPRKRRNKTVLSTQQRIMSNYFTPRSGITKEDVNFLVKPEKEPNFITSLIIIYFFLRSNRSHVLLSKFSQCRWPSGFNRAL